MSDHVAWVDEKGPVLSVYEDDREGCMRVHVAETRAKLAETRYRPRDLRAFGKAHLEGRLYGEHLAWRLATEGYIDPEGYLREGWTSTSRVEPTPKGKPGPAPRPIVHGTAAGYGAHRRRKIPMCDECRKARPRG